MPWTLLVRWLVRVLASMLVWRLASSRRAANTGRVPPLRRPPDGRRLDPREAAATIVHRASLGWRAITAAVFVAAAIVLATAGLTTTVLGPRWLGVVLLALAVAALAATAAEVRLMIRLVRERRRRRHDQALRSQLS